jgi:ABC-type multidrug transport system fused ATPase/permease subunit
MFMLFTSRHELAAPVPRPAHRQPHRRRARQSGLPPPAAPAAALLRTDAPTGTLVARLHGVETIREFVSGAAVTLILDFPFLLIFLAVMFAYSWQLSLIAVALLGLIA